VTGKHPDAWRRRAVFFACRIGHPAESSGAASAANLVKQMGAAQR
jgi:hypothetical protein